MQKKLLILLVVTQFCLLFSQEIKYGCSYNYPSEYGSIIIDKNSYSMKSLDGKEGILKETYKSKIYQKNSFTWLENIEKSNEKYIILTCSIEDLSFLTLVCTRDTSQNFYKNGEIYYNYCDNYKKYKSMPWLRGFNVIKADSFLIEKLKDGTEIKYLPEDTWISENPWAVKGDERKKIIYLESNTSLFQNKIVIANGFICSDKPYLYEQNSRAKKIRITRGSEIKDFELQDDPNFQILSLGEKEVEGAEQIKLEIIEVYHGSKYSDVVISGIYYIDAKVR